MVRQFRNIWKHSSVCSWRLEEPIFCVAIWCYLYLLTWHVGRLQWQSFDNSGPNVHDFCWWISQVNFSSYIWDARSSKENEVASGKDNPMIPDAKTKKQQVCFFFGGGLSHRTTDPAQGSQASGALDPQSWLLHSDSRLMYLAVWYTYHIYIYK